MDQAIIGRGCILPGANNPEELWDVVQQQKVVLRQASTRDWSIDPSEIVDRVVRTRVFNQLIWLTEKC